ncbi:hypothetical protein IQ227_20265 [Anabaena aphanizomenioides LEGE 00250]|uniref:Uncharacterized protein n=1 Tax=Sphaerospermopsis aphanizomenoides LEGE 00250 TaxID=2777972 RepID=A0ABR9VLK1_9CYAN|nr:hypothetical protein [Sphaerospermopsis aphanizomenoides]MBE9238290.1 hypothetical protein [Sphaerospermopsis aphanizomenoides LEGE 00250]
MMKIIENKPLFTQLSPEEAANVSGGNALIGAYTMIAFFIANGGAFLTREQAIIVMAVTLMQVESSFAFSSNLSDTHLSHNIASNLSPTFESP